MGILDAAAEEKARALQGCDASRMGIQGIRYVGILMRAFECLKKSMQTEVSEEDQSPEAKTYEGR